MAEPRAPTPSERPHGPPPGQPPGPHSEQPHGPQPEAFDRELSVRGVVGFLIGLAMLAVVTFAVMWLLFGALQRQQVAHDPAPPPMAEAREQRLPPEPRLQRDPRQDLAAMRTQENRVLGGYGWVDSERGIARVPVDSALAIVARAGLPVWPEPAPADSAAASNPAGASPGAAASRPAKGKAPRSW
jgi:hypothetical protein